MSTRPNILFIMTDEQRYDSLGYRNPQVYTPHLDALKKESVHFCNAYTTNPSCVPARAAIFSGKYPSQCGAPAYITPLESTETTFMTHLQEAGYYTAVIGKQHFAGAKVEHGYDYEQIVDLHGPDFSVDDPYTAYLRQEGFQATNELMEIDDKFSFRWKVDSKYHVDGFLGNKGKEWIENESTKLEQPWFFCLSFPGPHQPFNGIGLPTEDLYEEENISLPISVQSDLDQKPSFYWDQILYGKGNPGQMPVKDATPEQTRRSRKSYYSVVSFIDEKIGAVIDALKKSGQYENTVILYTADHGEYMGDFGMFGKAQHLTQSLMRVPFLMKPAVKDFQGYEAKEYVLNFEVAPTCIELAGLKVPQEMSARSLLPYCNGGKPETELDYLYTEALNLRAVQNEEWKIIYYQNKEYGELYHLAKDPEERINLWEDPTCQVYKQELMKVLCDKMIGLGRNAQSTWTHGVLRVR